MDSILSPRNGVVRPEPAWIPRRINDGIRRQNDWRDTNWVVFASILAFEPQSLATPDPGGVHPSMPRARGLITLHGGQGMAGARDSGRVTSEGQGQGDDGCFVTELGDVSLVVAVTRRNRDALGEVYRRHGAQVYGLARRVSGDDRANDVVQQVFLEMWEKPHRYNPDRGSLRTFLLTQAYGRSIDRLRSDGARRAREAACVLVAETAVGVETTVLAGSASDKVWRLLNVLPDGQRDAIVLAYFKGYTYRDVADLLGEPEGTVKSRIRAGLTRLRLALSQEGYQSAGSLV
jgi:RNA polymerase sigma-70 factor (ECF subfamily)